MTPTQTGPRPQEEATPGQTDRLKAFIETRLARREPPEQIAAAVWAYFDIALDEEQVVPFWRGEITLPTQTEHRPDKESVQIPADAVKEPLFTRMADAETEDAVPAVLSESAMPGAREEDAQPTQTGHRQDEEAVQIPVDAVDPSSAARMARGKMLEALAEQVKVNLGIAPAPAFGGAGGEDACPTQTGHRQEQPRATLTDEIKAFIVRGLARYETPTRVAAAVKLNFGIEIDRRQVFAYDPDGSRPPARRWIDLHAATRAKFLSDMAGIGIAQKVVRLRMLDRFARSADEQNFTMRAAAFLEQAARECGGIYESGKAGLRTRYPAP